MKLLPGQRLMDVSRLVDEDNNVIWSTPHDQERLTVKCKGCSRVFQVQASYTWARFHDRACYKKFLAKRKAAKPCGLAPLCTKPCEHGDYCSHNHARIALTYVYFESGQKKISEAGMKLF